MPNSMTTHLPSNLTKTNIYQKLVYEMKQRGKPDILSQSYFFDIWKKNFSHVTIPKVSVRIKEYPHLGEEIQWNSMCK